MMPSVELPATQCFFARIPRPIGQRRVDRQELVYAFEGLLPVPLDEVQMCFAIVGESVVGCACRRSELVGYRATARAVVPATLPGWIEIDDADAVRQRLNLLTGEMRPLVYVRRKRVTLQVACLAMVAASCLFYLGADRRAGVIREDTGVLRDEIRGLYGQVLPRSAVGESQPDSIRFATVMNRLAATRTGTRGEQDGDLIAALAGSLSRWPTDAKAQVRSIVINPDGLRIEASMPDNEHASGLLDHFRSDPDWQLASHQVAALPDRVDLSLNLVPEQGGGQDAGE